MQREKAPAKAQSLSAWLKEDRDPKRVALVLEFLRQQPAADRESADSLLAIAEGLEDGPVLAETLRLFGKYPKISAGPLLARKLDSAKPEVRAAAIETLGELNAVEGRERLVALLADPDPHVRRAAARAAGKLHKRRAIEPLLKLAAESDPLVRAASLDSLRLLKEPRVVPLAVAALGERQTELIALQCLRELGGPKQAGPVADVPKRNPSLDVLAAAVKTLTAWRERSGTTLGVQQDLDLAVAEIQGASGSLVRWNVNGSSTLFAVGTEGRVVIADKGAKGRSFEARTNIAVVNETAVEFLTSSGRLQIWLNGKLISGRDVLQTASGDSNRIAATLAKGNNRLVVSVEATSPESPVAFDLRFRRKSALAQHERLAQAILTRPGNHVRGREVLLNVEKSLCLKCHRLKDQGERTGPELTGLGNRFSRIYIAESILEPSRAIAPSYGTLNVRLESGQALSGVKVEESESTLTLADNQGVRHVVTKADIEDQGGSYISTMPEGLEKRLTEEEFVDLVAFLASLKP
jgi:putative heme-binding domain-containing protein